MRLSKKKQAELYEAIHDELVKIRIRLALDAYHDVLLAQVETSIWRRMKGVLKLPVEV
jgi:hypothetical protein